MRQCRISLCLPLLANNFPPIAPAFVCANAAVSIHVCASLRQALPCFMPPPYPNVRPMTPKPIARLISMFQGVSTPFFTHIFLLFDNI